MNRLTPLLLSGLLTLHAGANAQETYDVGFAVLGARILVADTTTANRFYGDLLGLDWALVAPDVPPRGEGLDVVLSPAATGAPAAYRSSPRAIVNLRVPDLWKTMRDLEATGVEFENGDIQRNGIGLDATLLTPDGDTHYLMEVRAEPPPESATPSLYNLELHVSDLERAIELYSGLMGFERRTDDYWPIMPLWHQGGDFALVLSGDPAREAAPIRPPGRHAATMLVFATDDLDQAQQKLAEHPGMTIVEPPERSGSARRMVFADAEGIVSELWEFRDLVLRLSQPQD